MPPEGWTMAKKLVEIEGIGSTYARQLEEAGVKSQEDLLEEGGTPKGRKDLEAKTGISGKLILGWINRADLARVKGIGEEYADLLELAAVNTVPELAQRNPANLHKKIEEIATEKKNVVRRVPSESEVARWVAQAKELPRVVSY
jgi:predicted flap endonuclease-1-like 5' DNA nuclease